MSKTKAHAIAFCTTQNLALTPIDKYAVHYSVQSYNVGDEVHGSAKRVYALPLLLLCDIYEGCSIVRNDRTRWWLK